MRFDDICYAFFTTVLLVAFTATLVHHHEVNSDPVVQKVTTQVLTAR